MRKGFLIPLTLGFFITCAAQMQPPRVFMETGRFQVAGTIKGYQPGANNGYVLVQRHDWAGQPKDSSLKIDAAGHFQGSLPLPLAGEIGFMYNDEFITLYASPGELIKMEIDEAAWPAPKNKNLALSLAGRSAAISRLILDYDFEKSQHPFLHQANLGDTTLSDSGYAVARTVVMNEELDYFRQWVKARNIRNNNFIQWMRNHILYSAASHIALKCFLGKINRTLTYDRFMGYLKAFPLNNPAALNNAEYYSLLNMVATGYVIMASVNPEYREQVKAAGDNDLPLNFAQANSWFRGISRELVYLGLYAAHKAKSQLRDLYYSDFDHQIREPYLKKLLVEQKAAAAVCFAPFNIFERLKKEAPDDSLATRLRQILAAHQGQYLFLDFWTSSCGPCLMEMPHYPSLIKAFNGKPLAFLFLAADTRPEKIQEIKERHQIDADFISLNGNEIHALYNVLQFSWYPSHFIIDPKGMLVKNNFLSAFSGGLPNEAFVKEVEQLISAK